MEAGARRGTLPAGWGFAEAAIEAGWNGLPVPSVQAAGRNLVLWRWNAPGAPEVRFIDPLGYLPRDLASWPAGPRQGGPRLALD